MEDKTLTPEQVLELNKIRNEVSIKFAKLGAFMFGSMLGSTLLIALISQLYVHSEFFDFFASFITSFMIVTYFIDVIKVENDKARERIAKVLQSKS